MRFCRHCGNPVDSGRFCAACGGPIAPDAIAATGARRHRQRNQLRFLLAALGLLLVVTMGLIVSRMMHREPAGSGSPSRPAASTSLLPLPQPFPTQPAAVQTPPTQAVPGDRFNPQPPPPPQTSIPDQALPASPVSTRGIDPNEVENALTMLAQKSRQSTPSPQNPAPSAASDTGSDRYPGSQPLEVKDVELPDIGVPITSQVYTTSDSLSTVIAYYTGRYPDAEVMEVNGQKVIAVNRPGATKVIALGSTGQETRIAILQPAN
jgi:hypothetical protein